MKGTINPPPKAKQSLGMISFARIFHSFSFNPCNKFFFTLGMGTRLIWKNMMLDEKTIHRMWIMRKYLADMNPVEAMDFINDRFKKTRNNEEFLISMND